MSKITITIDPDIKQRLIEYAREESKDPRLLGGWIIRQYLEKLIKTNAISPDAGMPNRGVK